MDDSRSRLVFIVSDDDEACQAYRQCALGNGANVFTARGHSPETAMMLSPWLAAVVVDVRSAETAWNIVESLRMHEATARTPIVLRYDRDHAISASLLFGLDPICGVEDEQGIEAACEALTEALGRRSRWAVLAGQVGGGIRPVLAMGLGSQ